MRSSARRFHSPAVYGPLGGTLFQNNAILSRSANSSAVPVVLRLYTESSAVWNSRELYAGGFGDSKRSAGSRKNGVTPQSDRIGALPGAGYQSSWRTPRACTIAANAAGAVR